MLSAIWVLLPLLVVILPEERNTRTAASTWTLTVLQCPTLHSPQPVLTRFSAHRQRKYQKTPVSTLNQAGVLSLPERGIVVIILRHTNEAYLLPSSSTSFLTLLLSHRFTLQQGSFFLLLSSSCEIAKTSECCRHVEAFGLCWILVQRSAGRVQTHTCQYSDSCWGPFASRKANRRHRPQAHE